MEGRKRKEERKEGMRGDGERENESQTFGLIT